MLLGAVLVAGSAGAEEAEGASAPVLDPAVTAAGVGGFREAVFTVGDLDAWVTTMREVIGWELVHRGPADDALRTLWALDSAWPVDEAVMRNPGTDRGFLRFVRIGGGRHAVMRSGAQSWDTGGHFDVNLRAADLASTYRRFEDRGWTAYSPPVRFTFGPFTVEEVIVRGPDGVVLAMIERIAPTLEGWPHLEVASRVFNATQVVADFERARSFFVDQLGFRVYLDHHGPSRAAGPNVLGLPHDLTTTIPRRVVIVSPDARNDGSVELLAFDGARGAAHGASAKPPNRGIATLRFPVDDLAAWHATLSARGVPIDTPPVTLALPPYGTVDLLAIRTPEGASLEFFQERQP